MFVPNLAGTLMKIEEDPITRYRYEIWFDYTRRAINTIAEGAMLAVPNFAGKDLEPHYSILEVTGLLPIHYALGSDTSGYPGFLVEAARNAGQDWMTQDETSTEDTTKIRCIAIPTNLEIVDHPFSNDADRQDIAEEGNLPMVGHQVSLLDTSTTERVANLNVNRERENTIQIGTLVRDEDVRVFLRVEDLIKVHFGIFGFTGAGKSNLLSTLVRKLLTESDEPVKIVIFDLMSEYTGLLLDQLVDLPGARVVNIGAHAAPQSVLEYYDAGQDGTPSPEVLKKVKKKQLEKATIDYTNTTVLPKALKKRQDDLHWPVAKLLHDGKVVFWQAQQQTLGRLIEESRSDVLKGTLGNSLMDVRKLIKELTDEYRQTALTPESLEEVEQRIEAFQQTPKLPPTAIKNLDGLLETLRSGLAAAEAKVEIPNRVRVNIPQLIDALDDPSESVLFVVQAHDPDELRKFASQLADFTYEKRRRSGAITPLVSFIFDEADEFIPGQPTSDSQKSTKLAAMTLARRGRKFGLGIGIATQRIANLDVNTLAQPHTYFVSKLPRDYDRKTVASAFGISEDMFRQTFKFKKGDWLLASYDATGLEAIPLPIHAEDANKRITDFIERVQARTASRSSKPSGVEPVVYTSKS